MINDGVKSCESEFSHENGSCQAFESHNDLRRQVKEILPEEEQLFDLAELFKIFGDSTRIKILYILFESEMCVCDIADILGMTVSAISHQLRILKNAKLVKNRREGKSLYYSLADNHISLILGQGMEHILE